MRASRIAPMYSDDFSVRVWAMVLVLSLMFGLAVALGVLAALR